MVILRLCLLYAEGKNIYAHLLVNEAQLSQILYHSSIIIQLYSFLFLSPSFCLTETFDVLIRQAENHTNAVLHESYRTMADQALGPVQELFTDISLFLLGSELNVDDLVQRFFDSLFPLVYNHLINPGLSDISSGYAECVRLSRRDMRPFGAAPSLLADQIARSGVSGKLLLQALHLGIEVINTTDHLQLSRECRRALLKMHYCPHCQVKAQVSEVYLRL